MESKRTVQEVTVDWRQTDLFGEEECFLSIVEGSETVHRDGPYKTIKEALLAYEMWVNQSPYPQHNG